jgi:hypothetical protein
MAVHLARLDPGQPAAGVILDALRAAEITLSPGQFARETGLAREAQR